MRKRYESKNNAACMHYMFKSFCAALLGLLLTVLPSGADDIVLADGTVLKNAEIVQHDESNKTVTIVFADGTAIVHSEALATNQRSAIINPVSQTVSVSTSVPAPLSLNASENWTVNYKTFHNVKVTKVDVGQVEITYDGGLGALALKDLPSDLQERFNFDPAAAKIITDQKDQQAAQSDAMVAAQLKQKDKDEQAEAIQQQPHETMKMLGTVLQKLPDGGLLIHSEMGDNGVFMLKGVPNETNLVDNDSVYEMVYRSGQFSYTSSEGVRKSIAAYTAVGPVPTQPYVAPAYNP